MADGFSQRALQVIIIIAIILLLLTSNALEIFERIRFLIFDNLLLVLFMTIILLIWWSKRK